MMISYLWNWSLTLKVYSTDNENINVFFSMRSLTSVIYPLRRRNWFQIK